MGWDAMGTEKRGVIDLIITIAIAMETVANERESLMYANAMECEVFGFGHSH